MVKVKGYTHMQNKQSGIAAIFTVVFFTLLISVIILSFIKIVTQDQQQATNSDLSNSAYDSAEAGVEDAKRALKQYNMECVELTTPDTANCAKYTNGADTGALDGAQCNSFQSLTNIVNPSNVSGSEVKVATNSTDDSLDQAYTCLKVELQTKDYERTLSGNDSDLIHLKTVNDAAFNEIHLNWFNKEDNKYPKVETLPTASGFNLPVNDGWPNDRPPILRAQIVAVPRGAGQVDSQFIDNNSRAVFMYPNQSGANPIDIAANDIGRRWPKSSPVSADCKENNAEYACNVVINSFKPGNGGYDYYLRVTPIYNNATFQVQLFDTASATPAEPVLFDGVEPIVDSTGRANDVFRRVVSRVTFDDGGENVSGGSGFDITQGLCKAFSLADGYIDPATGNPKDYYRSNCPDTTPNPSLVDD